MIMYNLYDLYLTLIHTVKTKLECIFFILFLSRTPFIVEMVENCKDIYTQARNQGPRPNSHIGDSRSSQYAYTLSQLKHMSQPIIQIRVIIVCS